MTHLIRKYLCGFAAVLSVMALVGCKEEEIAEAKPMEVSVLKVGATSVAVKSELPGRTTAFMVSQVRARVDGIVVKRAFTEGEEVKAGQVLYQIDPAPFRAALNSAEANLERTMANSVAQNSLAQRYGALIAENAISRQEYENAVSAKAQADAEVRAAQATVEMARINLGYTDVVSPITGRIGISMVTPGAYVRASDATLMTTVQQTHPMYVDLSQSSADGLRLRADLLEGRLEKANANARGVKLTLEDGRTYSELGELKFADISVDQGTGTVTVRAVFPNKDRLLLPGMFVRAQLVEGQNTTAMLIPQTAIWHDQSGRPNVMTVDADSKIEQTVLTTAGMNGPNWVVTEGLTPGDQVVIQGRAKVRPGDAVTVVAADMKAFQVSENEVTADVQ